MTNHNCDLCVERRRSRRVQAKLMRLERKAIRTGRWEDLHKYLEFRAVSR